MRRIRVMVVDDSPATRELVIEALATDPRLEFVAQAANGAIALQRIPLHKPDVITLDVDMPVMNGLTFLRTLERRADPAVQPRVIMFSSYTIDGARVTLEALDAGAADYVTKPAGTVDRAGAVEAVRAELLPRIRALCENGPDTVEPPAKARPGSASAPTDRYQQAREAADHAAASAAAAGAHTRAESPQAPNSPVARTGPERAVQLVVMAASTGGPPALMRVLQQLPATFPVPIAIVQHMPPLFTEAFAQRLDAACALEVREAKHAESMRKGQVRIAPGGRHMEVTHRMTHRIELHDGPMENSVRPSADVLFRSAARSHGGSLLAVVLTGMGHDGLAGARAVREAGGTVIVQDRKTCTVWGMPRAIEEDGLADLVLPLDAIAAELLKRVQTGR